jgi:predicted transposase/invertase (TIGR01784 family)
MEREEGIAMASEVLMTISKDEAERSRLMSEYKYQMDMQSKLVHAKRVGIKEGIEKGIEKGRLEDAKNMLRKVLSIDLIYEITGLDTKTIQSL